MVTKERFHVSLIQACSQSHKITKTHSLDCSAVVTKNTKCLSVTANDAKPILPNPTRLQLLLLPFFGRLAAQPQNWFGGFDKMAKRLMSTMVLCHRNPRQVGEDGGTFWITQVELSNQRAFWYPKEVALLHYHTHTTRVPKIGQGHVQHVTRQRSNGRRISLSGGWHACCNRTAEL